MKQTPCSNLYFPAGSGALLTASSKASLIVGKIGGYDLSGNQLRPFIPFCGMALDASGAYKPLTVASNQNNKDTFLKFFTAAFNASKNYVFELVAQNDNILNGDDNYFASYLYKKLDADIYMMERYNSIAGIVWNFWNNADVAWTNAQYYDALLKLQAFLEVTADPNLYIAPAYYDFNDAVGDFAAAITAWKAADANFVAFDTLEISIA